MTDESPASKPHHATLRKEKAEKYDSLAIEHAALKAQLDEVMSRLDKEQPPKPTAPATISDIDIPEGFPSDWDGYSYLEDLDPLREINERTFPEFFLVSQDSSILRCPTGHSAKMGHTWVKSYQHKESTRKWKHRHIVYVGRTDDETRQNEKANTKWHHFRIVPYDGDIAFPEGHPRRSPKKAIVYKELFHGVHPRGHLIGTPTEASGNTYREYLRLLLQSGAREYTFINFDYDQMQKLKTITQDHPNPYCQEGGGNLRSSIKFGFMAPVIGKE